METHGRPPDLLKLVTCVQSVETLVWDVPAGSKVVREWREEGDECMLSGRDSLAAVALYNPIHMCMLACMRTYIHTYIHTDICIHTYIDLNTCMHTYIHTYRSYIHT